MLLRTTSSLLEATRKLRANTLSVKVLFKTKKFEVKKDAINHTFDVNIF